MRTVLGVLACCVSVLGLFACSVFPFGGRGGLPGGGDTSPVFDLDATPRLLASGQAVVDVRMTVPNSLARGRQMGNGAADRVRWTVEILTRPQGQQVYEASWIQIVAVSDSTDQQPFASRVVDVPPGDLLVAVTAEDETTGMGFTKRQEISIPAEDGPVSVLGVRIESARPGQGWKPQISGAVNVDRDSLRVRAQVVNGLGQVRRIVVERLNADSSVALPPFAMGRQPASLSVRGVQIEARVRDTTFVEERLLAGELTEVSQVLPSLRTGTYRIRMEAGTSINDRFLVVRRVGFPEVERVGDLIAPLRYILTESEMRALTARVDPYLQRRAFDRFWGDHIPDRRLAASTVREYAERVEEANRRFSNQKEGWKTDRGMAFVLFGPPQRVERGFRSERWIYSAGPVSGLVLEFQATEDLPSDWPYEVWVLRRGPAYDVAWQRARRAWRRGDVP